MEVLKKCVRKKFKRVAALCIVVIGVFSLACIGLIKIASDPGSIIFITQVKADGTFVLEVNNGPIVEGKLAGVEWSDDDGFREIVDPLINKLRTQEYLSYSITKDGSLKISYPCDNFWGWKSFNDELKAALSGKSQID